MPSSNVITTFAAVSTVGILSAFGAFLYSRKKKNQVPEEWTPVGKVTNLYLYPLKSGRGIDLKEGQCTEYGLTQTFADSSLQLRDRCLVVYKESNNEFKTARTYPRMVLIEITMHDNEHIALDAPGMRQLYVKLPASDGEKRSVSMWQNEQIPAIDCGDEAASWVSRYILDETSGLRLGYHTGEQRRDLTKTHSKMMKQFKNLCSESTGMYSDLSSYMLMNKASVDELSNRVPNSTVTVNQFRPNIVVEEINGTPFAEDDWDWIKVGYVVFRNVKPCTRCIFTTINPLTGEMDKKGEPLKTLKSYRLPYKDQKPSNDNSPMMGINMGLQMGGVIHVDDVVYVGKN